MQQRQAQPEVVALFVSDVHLQPGMPRTVQAFLQFLRGHAARAQRLYLLGDLFEYWAGDDDLDAALHQQVVTELAALAATGVQIGWLPGNRDFLTGDAFAAAAGLQLLEEPHVTELCGQRIVLMHGDAQCTDDHDYQAFRAQVRNPAWQAGFLAQPLAQRKAIIAAMRSGSRAAQRDKSYEIMDVNASAIALLFEQTGAQVMVHGHTHRPALHQHAAHGSMRQRHVLPDWDCDARPARGGWLALDSTGRWTRFRHDGSVEPIRTAS